MEKETQDVRLDLRVSRKLYDDLAALATKDNRKISDYSRLVLKDHVARSAPKK